MPRAVRSAKVGAEQRTDAVFRALADPTRRRIVLLLAAGEMRTSDIAARFPVSRPAISKHLAVLKRAGLAAERRVGRERRYRLTRQALAEAAGYVRDVEAFWDERLGALDARLSGR
ncbi:MAG: metalloregulator ArsR/SmtB family transcription factor [Thermoplasmatota archaeon]